MMRDVPISTYLPQHIAVCSGSNTGAELSWPRLATQPTGTLRGQFDDTLCYGTEGCAG